MKEKPGVIWLGRSNPLVISAGTLGPVAPCHHWLPVSSFPLKTLVHSRIDWCTTFLYIVYWPRAAFFFFFFFSLCFYCFYILSSFTALLLTVNCINCEALWWTFVVFERVTEINSFLFYVILRWMLFWIYCDEYNFPSQSLDLVSDCFVSSVFLRAISTCAEWLGGYIAERKFILFSMFSNSN